ncbi:unnamed protein product, partial [Prorocentrum cordatum]
ARHRSSAALLRREMADMEARHAAALSRHEDAAARRLSAAERDFAAVLRGMRPAGRAEEAAGEGHPQAAQFATPAGSSRSRSPSPSEQDSLQRALGLLRRRADLAAAAGAGADAELAEALAAERERSERRLVAVERSEGAGGAEGPIAVRSRAPAREPRMAHDPCVPEWRAESPSSECPYGWVFPAPFCPFTVPDELTVGLLLACTYSLLPLVVVVGIAALAVLRREASRRRKRGTDTAARPGERALPADLLRRRQRAPRAAEAGPAGSAAEGVLPAGLRHAVGALWLRRWPVLRAPGGVPAGPGPGPPRPRGAGGRAGGVAVAHRLLAGRPAGPLGAPGAGGQRRGRRGGRPVAGVPRPLPRGVPVPRAGAGGAARAVRGHRLGAGAGARPVAAEHHPAPARKHRGAGDAAPPRRRPALRGRGARRERRGGEDVAGLAGGLPGLGPGQPLSSRAAGALLPRYPPARAACRLP